MLRPRRQSDVRSLFGATPEQVRQRQLEGEREFLAQMQSDPYQSAGAAIGVGLGRLFGGKSKAETEAEQREEAVKGIDELGAMAEAEAAQRGMAPLAMTEPDVLAREANRLESVSAAFRNMGQDTGELDNEVLRLRVEANKAKRAIELEDLQRQNIGLQMEKTQFDLDEAWENQPENKRALALANQLRDLQIQTAETNLTNTQEATKLKEKGRKQAETFFKGKKGFEYLAPLVATGAIEPAKAMDAFIELSKQPSLDLIEIGNYTTTDGSVVLGAFDKNSNKFLQYTDSGWLAVPAGTLEQGRRPEGSVETITPMVSSAKEMETELVASPDILKATEALSQVPQNELLALLPGVGLTTTDEETLISVQNELIRRAREIQKNVPEGAKQGISAKDALTQALNEVRQKTTSGSSAIKLGPDGKLGR